MAPKRKGKDKGDMEDVDGGSGVAPLPAPVVALDSATDLRQVGINVSGNVEAGNVEAGTGGVSVDPQTLEEIEEGIKATDGSRVVHATPSGVLNDVGKSGCPPGGLSSFKIAPPVASPAKPTVTPQALEFFNENKQKFAKLYIDNIYEVVLPRGGKTITKNVLKQILTDDAVAREVQEDVAEEEDEEEEEEEVGHLDWGARDPTYDYEDGDGLIKNYLMLPNVGSVESQNLNETEALNKLRQEMGTSNYTKILTEMAEELKERKYAKSEADGFNCAVELIETLEKNDSVFRDTFLKAFMPGFKHFAVLPHAIDKTEMKLKKIAEAKVIVSARVADKKAAKSKIESAKKAKRDLKNALNPGSSSAVEPSKVARKSRGGSASDSALRMLMLK